MRCSRRSRIANSMPIVRENVLPCLNGKLLLRMMDARRLVAVLKYKLASLGGTVIDFGGDDHFGSCRPRSCGQRSNELRGRSRAAEDGGVSRFQRRITLRPVR